MRFLMAAASYKAILKHHAAAPSGIRDYFDHILALVQTFPYEVCIAYMFSRVERAQNMTLYCGVVKLHSAHISVAKNVIHKQHITRDSLLELFETVFGKPVSATITNHLKFAEKTRDQVVHGKNVSDADLRKAIVEIIDYAKSFDTFVDGIANFKPFGDLRGFKGRATPLEKSTTRWLLKGLGFAMS